MLKLNAGCQTLQTIVINTNNLLKNVYYNNYVPARTVYIYIPRAMAFTPGKRHSPRYGSEYENGLTSNTSYAITFFLSLDTIL